MRFVDILLHHKRKEVTHILFPSLECSCNTSGRESLKQTVGGGCKCLEKHSSLWQTLHRLLGGEGVDNEPNCMEHCGKAPITRLGIEIILNKSELRKQPW